MNREEVENMQAGLTADQKIAKGVMCWHLDDGYWYDGEKLTGYNQYDFNPTEDISAAWMVVHKMSEKNFWAYVGSLSSVCYCVFYDGEGNHQRGEAPIYQEPLAICRAALLAVTPTN